MTIMKNIATLAAPNVCYANRWTKSSQIMAHSLYHQRVLSIIANLMKIWELTWNIKCYSPI